MAEQRCKLLLKRGESTREVSLPMSGGAAICIGTTRNCQVRYEREAFPEDFEIQLQHKNAGWELCPSENCTYWVMDGLMRIEAKALSHGDAVTVKYANQNNTILSITLFYDFDVAAQDYRRAIDISGAQQITIGGGPGCMIYLADPQVMQEAVALQRVGMQWRIHEENSKYGVFINGCKAEGNSLLRDNDFFFLGGFGFCIKKNQLFTSSEKNIIIRGLRYQDYYEQASALAYPIFLRSTRIKNVIPSYEIDVLPPKPTQEPPEESWLMAIVPPLLMIGMVVVLRGMLGGGGTFVIYSVASMALSTGVGIINRKRAKKKLDEKDTKRKEAYLAYIQKKIEEIVKKRQEEYRILHRIYRPMEDNLATVRNFDKGLFDRAIQDNDFLDVRLGIGTVASKSPIKVNRQEYKDTADPLMDIPEEIEQKYQNLENAPIVSRFHHSNAVGIVGNKIWQYELLKNAVLDLAIRQYHKELKLYFIFPEAEQERFAWLRWLQNATDEVSSLRNFLYDEESIKMQLEVLYRILSSRESAIKQDQEEEWPVYYVVFSYDCEPIRNHPISQYIEQCKKYGFTFVFFDQYEERIPRGCTEIIRIDEDRRAGTLILTENGDIASRFLFPEVTDTTAKEIVSKMSAIRVVESSLESEMTKSVSLFQLLGILRVDDLDLAGRWRDSKIYKSMSVPLGVKTKNDVVYLDLHEKFHGPHGLVAGTTGSGKSEILQSYVLSMASAFHPHDVGFLIIDFKGGGMANQFLDLPHLLGSITNMEGREVQRSLKSIKAELMRRQSLFAKAGVNHIDAYIRLHKENPREVKVPLPHLIIIVDEFAELKMEQPDFMKELISAARIGRSLGVHLILATQKPAGQVDDQIWSNSKFKLCLKVQTKEDSNEVLKTPLAAEIREPGRAYLQVGNNEIFELFQSAYSGAKVRDISSGSMRNFKIAELNLGGRQKVVYQSSKGNAEESATELQTLVAYTAAYCRQHNIEKLPSICLKPLPDSLVLGDIASSAVQDNRIWATLGIYDDPEMQTQAPLALDLTESNTFILGSAQTGKTVLIQTLIASLARDYTPLQVHAYVLDCGNSLPKTMEQSGIVGGIVHLAEEDSLFNLLNILKKEFISRRNSFGQANVGNYKAYLEAGMSDLPYIFVIIDNVVSFKEYYPELYEEYIQLSREGIGVGLYLIITSSQFSVLSSKVMTGFGTRLSLSLNDSSEYSALFERCHMVPKEIPGRGLIMLEKRILEYQTALCIEGNTERERNQNLVAMLENENLRYGGHRARKIPVIPDLLTAASFYQDYKMARQYHIPLGLSYNTIEPVELDLTDCGLMPIIGRSKSGKTNLVKQILAAIQRTTLFNRTECYIIDSPQQPLEFCHLEYGFVAQYSVDIQDSHAMMAHIVEELEKRQQEIIDSRGNLREEEILKRYPLLLYVAEHPDFMAEVSRSKETMALFGKFAKLSRFKAAILMNNIENVSFSSMNMPELAKKLRDNKQAILFEDLPNLRAYDTPPIKILRQYPKPIVLGDAYIYKGGAVIDKVKTIYLEDNGR